MFDLPGYCANRLYGCGITKVSMAETDTYSKESEYFSYRRTTHHKEPDYGRHVHAIALERE